MSSGRNFRYLMTDPGVHAILTMMRYVASNNNADAQSLSDNISALFFMKIKDLKAKQMDTTLVDREG